MNKLYCYYEIEKNKSRNVDKEKKEIEERRRNQHDRDVWKFYQKCMETNIEDLLADRGY